MWQSRVETEDYSVVCFDCIAVFKAPYRWTFIKGRARTRSVDSLHASTKHAHVWTPPLTELQRHGALNVVMRLKYVTEYSSISARDCPMLFLLLKHLGTRGWWTCKIKQQLWRDWGVCEAEKLQSSGWHMHIHIGDKLRTPTLFVPYIITGSTKFIYTVCFPYYYRRQIAYPYAICPL